MTDRINSDQKAHNGLIELRKPLHLAIIIKLNTLISFLYSVSSLRLNHKRRKCCTSDSKRFLLSIS